MRNGARKLVLIASLALLTVLPSIGAAAATDAAATTPVRARIAAPVWHGTFADSTTTNAWGIVVDVDEDGNTEHVLVADHGEGLIAIHNSEGALQETFGSDELNGPTGMTIGPDGLLYVANRNSGTIEVFTIDGDSTDSFDPAELVSSPVDIAFDSFDRLLVVGGDGTIDVLDSDGEWLGECIDLQDDATFVSIATNSEGHVLVLSSVNMGAPEDRLLRLEPDILDDGDVCTEDVIIENIVLADEITSTATISLDNHDRIYITDDNGGPGAAVYILTSTGESITSFSAGGSGNDEFGSIGDLTFTEDGAMLITDWDDGDVAIWDFWRCNGQPATLVGTAGNDDLEGTSERDIVVARAGDDTVFGRGGNDLICLGSGDDTGIGGSGDDKIFGGGGDDWIEGYSGDDTVRGNQGNDVVIGNSGDDILNGNSGNDELTGERGADFLRGGAGDDLIFGGADDDILIGGPADDDLIGGPSDGDLCRGGGGEDTAAASCETISGIP